MKTEISAGVAGYFKLEAVNAETGERRVLADWFPNLITDLGMDRIGAGSSLFGAAMVGDGSTPPANGDGQLANWVASGGSLQGTSGGYVPGTPFHMASRATYRFAQGAAAGNLTEVGMSWGSVSGNLFCRSLIKDGNGNPTTITVLASEYLDVTYELRFYPPQTDQSFNLTIAGVTHACTIRAAQTSQWVHYESLFYGGASFTTGSSSNQNYLYSSGASLGPVTGGPTGAASVTSVSAATNQTYVAGSYTKHGTLSIGLNDGNLSGGISAYVFQTYIGCYQVTFNPPIAKTNTKTMTISPAISWARR